MCISPSGFKRITAERTVRMDPFFEQSIINGMELIDNIYSSSGPQQKPNQEFKAGFQNDLKLLLLEIAIEYSSRNKE